MAEARGFQATARRARLATIDGRPGLAVWSERQLSVALLFTISGERIVHYDVVADPQRLAVLRVADW